MGIEITGIESAKQTVERYLNLQVKCLEIAKRLCEIGEPIIRGTHGNHAVIMTEPTEKGYKISAEGEDVLFIEFGTGQMAGKEAALYDRVPSVVGEGTWSASHAQMYSRFGFWVFAGEIYHYTMPHPAFYYAYEAMVEALPKIASEVFGT